MKLRVLFGLLIFVSQMVFAQSQQMAQCRGKQVWAEEFLVQYKQGARSRDKTRVLKLIHAKFVKTIQTAVMKANGQPGFDVISVQFDHSPTEEDNKTIVAQGEADSAVQFIEINAGFKAASICQE